MPNPDVEVTAALDNESDEKVMLAVDSFGEAMRVCLTIPANVEDGVEKHPRQSIQFTSSEWDTVIIEVEKARQARKLFDLPA